MWCQILWYKPRCKYKVAIIRITIKRYKVRVKWNSCSFEMLSQIAIYKFTLQDKKPDYDIKSDFAIWKHTVKYKVANTRNKSHNYK